MELSARQREALQNVIFCLPGMDFGAKAGGAYLTFRSLLQAFLVRGVQPTLYIERIEPSLDEDLNARKLPVLSKPEFAQVSRDPKKLTFVFPWHTCLAPTLKVANPRRLMIRQAALEHPFCSNVLVQKNQCWDRCNAAKYYWHLPKNRLGLHDAWVGRMGAKYFKRAEAMNFNSTGVQSLMQQRFPSLRQIPSEILYESIDFDPKNQGLLDWTRFADAPLAFLLVSKWGPQKGLREVLPVLTQHHRAVVIGDGPDVDTLKREQPSLNAQYLGQVPFERLLEVVPKNARYVYVHPARWFEAYGRTISEAMFAGLPVIIPESSGAAGDLGTTPGVFTYRRSELAALRDAITQVSDLSLSQYTTLQPSLQKAAESLSSANVIPRWLDYLERVYWRDV